MSSALEAIANELNDAKIQFEIADERIEIPLPNNFDTLIIEIWNDAEEDSVSLKNGSFHTHGNIEAREHGLPNRIKGIRYLVESIFNGTFKMVRRKNERQEYENTIWDTFSLALIDETDVYEVVSEI
ncbi:hypothetical protein [Arsukibacterium sp.]|uniref:hypothetical protein n=1 Tax=Arsukibacterium sp. TaxID=1977258 RepID=UPI00299F48FC|nr:hypothetical protein [Arsukibacterium sp.]MDX1538719.1 hypothetical protein [Arsukibacterium sp.]